MHATVVGPPTLRRALSCEPDGRTLASEFLRNLGWRGFKPDRHIQRLFSLWFPEVVKSCHERAVELAGLVGTRAKDVVAFFTFSLVGHAVTPPGRTFSEADNLVGRWGPTWRRRGGRLTWLTMPTESDEQNEAARRSGAHLEGGLVCSSEESV